jgi:hypothetical protein
MIEFYIDRVGVRFESVEALKGIIDNDMIEDVLEILYNLSDEADTDSISDDGFGFRLDGDDEK